MVGSNGPNAFCSITLITGFCALCSPLFGPGIAPWLHVAASCASGCTSVVSAVSGCVSFCVFCPVQSSRSAEC